MAVLFKLLIINLTCWLAWLSSIAVAQLELNGTVAGSVVNFPDVGITCIANLAVFSTSLLRGRFDTEIGARDILATHRGRKLEDIDGVALTTCWRGEYGSEVCNNSWRSEYELSAKVVMLSNHNNGRKPHSSITQLMRYIAHVHGVDSILLKCLPLQSAIKSETNIAVIGECTCETCRCIVIWTEDDITAMLVRQMPGTLKQLADSMCLLPCLKCMKKGCHGCSRDLLYVENPDEGNPNEEIQEIIEIKEEERLSEKEESTNKYLKPKNGDSEVESTDNHQKFINGNSEVEYPAAVCELLDHLNPGVIGEESNCICIPVCRAGEDEWTKLFIRSLRTKEKATREVRMLVADNLQNYIDQRGGCPRPVGVHYSSAALIVPRFIEVLINVVLTVWFRVDGFSSALVARRAVRDYIVDTQGTGFASNAFITEALVKFNEKKTNVCQVLRFRGGFVCVRILSYILGAANLICSIGWCVRIALKGGAGQWYAIHSMAPTTPRVVVMLAFIGIVVALDCFDWYLIKKVKKRRWKESALVGVVICLEIGSIVSGSIVWSVKKGLGTWVYSAMQVLVWIKWGIGSYILGDCDHDNGEDFDTPLSCMQDPGSKQLKDRLRLMFSRLYSYGTLMYSSALLLNATLAGVRGKWDYPIG